MCACVVPCAEVVGTEGMASALSYLEGVVWGRHRWCGWDHLGIVVTHGDPAILVLNLESHLSVWRGSFHSTLS